MIVSEQIWSETNLRILIYLTYRLEHFQNSFRPFFLKCQNFTIPLLFLRLFQTLEYYYFTITLTITTITGNSQE